MRKQLSSKEKAQVAKGRQTALNKAERAFDQHDLNGDGDLDVSEIRILALQSAGLPANATPEQIEEKIYDFISEYDENKDGRI